MKNWEIHLATTIWNKLWCSSHKWISLSIHPQYLDPSQQFPFELVNWSMNRVGPTSIADHKKAFFKRFSRAAFSESAVSSSYPKGPWVDSAVTWETRAIHRMISEKDQQPFITPFQIDWIISTWKLKILVVNWDQIGWNVFKKKKSQITKQMFNKFQKFTVVIQVFP